MELLKGRKAIITGGTGGIGFAIAKVFIQQGASVAILGNNQEKGEKAALELNQLSDSSCTFSKVNIGKTDEVESCLKKINESFGRVDILVNNAGITRDELLMKMSEEDWDEVLSINLKSCFNTCRFLVRPMLKARFGKIINISSVIGLVGNPGQANYAASKGGIIAFTKALALELASRNILVNCIAPGFIETNMTSNLTASQRESIIAKVPLGRMGLPQDIANAALFLASSLSDYMTGQVITVDGGMVM